MKTLIEEMVNVIRRVGGLEVWNGARYRRKIVIRRVGGLEE